MKYQIALTMKEIMLKNGRNTVWYGDLELIEECAELSGVKIQHPQKTIKYILDNLDRSPCFTKVLSRFMRKIVCRLRLNEVSRQ